MADTVLVTGGTGYVGGWCIKLLLDRGYRVRTTVRDLAREADVRAAVGCDDDRLAFVRADLTDDADWDEAVAGCAYALHVASPLVGGGTRNADKVIVPARDGTLRVLTAAMKAGVKRVVMTSAATAARAPLGSGIVNDETVWADPTRRKFDPYRLSKILAERAAWDFMATAQGATELTTVLPGAVFGPVLARDQQGSVELIAGLLDGRPSRLPRFGFWVVDVRDLADLHIRAMIASDAAGERFMAVGEFQWFSDVAATLRAGLGDRAAKVPTRTLPDIAVKLIALVNPGIRMLAAEVGIRNQTNSAKARCMLGFAPRPVTETIVDCAQSLLAS
jgi:nucleoside-diphosphate-sugar epimerase